LLFDRIRLFPARMRSLARSTSRNVPAGTFVGPLFNKTDVTPRRIIQLASMTLLKVFPFALFVFVTGMIRGKVAAINPDHPVVAVAVA
jgi:hypothetical protein